MTQIIRWPRHIRMRSGCSPYCTGCSGCMLFVCSTCTAAEGELFTDCPGEPVGPYMKSMRLDRRLDYSRAGGFVWDGEKLGRR